MDDVGPQFPEEADKREKTCGISPGVCLPDEPRGKAYGCFFNGLRFFVENAAPACDELPLEFIRVEMAHGVERVLLRSAEFELGDDVADFYL